jgi:glycosyltransferase 2 family protein
VRAARGLTSRVAQLRKHLKTIALVLFTTAILWRLWRGLDWTEVRRSLSQASALLIGLATAVSSVTLLLRAFRWRALLAPLAPVNTHDVFAATNIGIGSSFLFGAAVGELTRPLALSLLRPQVRRTVAFLTIVVERVCDISVLLVLFGLSLLWLPLYSGHVVAAAHAAKLGVVLIILPFIVLALLVLVNGRFGKNSDWLTESTASWKSVANPVKRFALRVIHQLVRALTLLAKRRVLVIVTFWTAVQWLSVILTTWLVLRAFGMPFAIKETIFVMSCGLVGSFVPTPGGAAGAFHAALSSGLIFLGATLDQAAAISIVAHLIGFVPALAFGSYYLLRSDLKVAQLQHEMSAAVD